MASNNNHSSPRDSAGPGTEIEADLSQIAAEDVPPPPYTETDLSSVSGGPRPTISDNASHVSSSSAGDVIYTPPETPRPSGSPRLPAAASHFFSTRPPPPQQQQQQSTRGSVSAVMADYPLDVRADSKPEDFPYTPDFAEHHDVTYEDWATFVNFLLPNHASRRNEAVLDRKLRAEEDSVSQADSARSYAEEQLADLREQAVGASERAQRRSDVQDTVRTWNEEFFLPRGLNMYLLPERPQDTHMPGSWDQSPERQSFLASAASPSSSAGAQQQQEPRRTSTMGRLQIDENGIRYGDSFRVDANQVRLGNLVLDASGIRLGGSAGTPRAFGQGRPAPHSHPRTTDPRGDGQAREEERGRAPQTSGVTQPRERKRSSSSHSSSSVSSSDSSSTESSIGSLPSYDDVREQQLPLYTERLRAWLARPDELRTRADVKQFRAELRGVAAASSSSLQSSPQDRAELRRQAKALAREWRDLKKKQRRTRREMQRERRQRRRAEKREERQRRREVRGARRDLRRGRTRSSPVVPEASAGLPSFANVPDVSNPSVPGQLHMPSMPSPWGQPRRCHPHRGGRGFFRGQPPFGADRGLFCQRGPLGSHGHFGPFGPRHHVGGGGPAGIRGGLFNPFGPPPNQPPGDPSHAPGAWPGDDCSNDKGGGCSSSSKVPGQDVSGAPTKPQTPPPPPGPASAEMYRTVERLEFEVSRKQETAAQVQDKTVREAMRYEIEALTRSLEVVRMNADEAYARELATAN